MIRRVGLAAWSRLALSVLVTSVAPARAQCPDGSPPPCVRRRPTPSPERPGVVYQQHTTTGRAMLPSHSPDGRHVAYLDSGVAMVLNLSPGATPVPAMRPEDGRRTGVIRAVTWSSDASLVMLSADSGYFATPLPSGVLRRVAGRRPGVAVLSPTADRIVNWAAPWKWALIRTIGSSTEDTVRIPGQYEFIMNIVWSPDGGSVVSRTVSGTQHTLRVHNLRTRRSRVLVTDSVHLAPITWSTADSSLYYLRGGVPTGFGNWYYGSLYSGSQLWRVHTAARGSRGAPELVEPQFPYAEISFATDGSSAIVRHSATSNVVVVGLGANAARRWLTHGTGLRQFPIFSHDGKQIAFIRHDGSSSNLFLVDSDSGAVRQLTFLEHRLVVRHAWSPDTRRIAICTWGEEGKRVGVIDLATGQTNWLRTETVSDDCGVAWLSDSEVAYQRPGNHNFAVTLLAGGAQRPLAARDSVAWFLFSPVAAPQGMQVAAFWSRPMGIWVLSRSDSTQRLLHQGQLLPRRWIAPDTLLLADAPPTYTRFYRLSVSAPERIDTIADARFCPNADISPDGTRIVCAEVSITTDIWLVRNPVRARRR